MTKQIKEYLAYITSFFKDEHTHEEYLMEKQLLLQRIELYQHERLIHLLVMLAFGIFFMLSLFMYMVVQGIGLLILSALFLVLLVPYIKHYYFLENSVQTLYKFYYQLEKM